MTGNTNLDRIRKLLTLAERSDSEHERETALSAAHRLMQRYNITLEEARDHEVNRFEAFSEEVWSGRRVGEDKRAVCTVLNDCFHVCAYVGCSGPSWCRQERVLLFGESHNVEIARYVFVFLCREFRRRWRARCLQTGHFRGERSYYLGLAVRVIGRLRADTRDTRETSESRQLQRINDRLEQAFRHQHGDCRNRTISATDPNQFAQGHYDGGDIQVRTPLRGQQQQALEAER